MLLAAADKAYPLGLPGFRGFEERLEEAMEIEDLIDGEDDDDGDEQDDNGELDEDE